MMIVEERKEEGLGGEMSWCVWKKEKNEKSERLLEEVEEINAKNGVFCKRKLIIHDVYNNNWSNAKNGVN